MAGRPQEKRLVGWQWLNGYARRVIKTRSQESAIRPLFQIEEVAVLKAGLKLDHDEGRRPHQVKDT